MSQRAMDGGVTNVHGWTAMITLWCKEPEKEVIEAGIHRLKQPVTSYMLHLEHEKQALSDNNTIESE